MPPRASRPVLSLEAATLGERPISGVQAHLDLELGRGEAALVYVDDDNEAMAMVDLCVGLAHPADGHVRFLGVDWRTRTRPQRLRRRRRIGVVTQTDVWPSHMSVMESILLAQLYHSDRPRDELIVEATGLARLFGLPGLPADPHDATRRQVLLRAGCVRGFLGSPDLVLVQDSLLDRTAELAVPLAQAINATQARGGAVLWISSSTRSPAAEFVATDQFHRLGDSGLVPVRRPR